MALDATDIKILAELQRDAARPIEEIAEAAGLTKTPCWRRIKRLEEAGVIRGRVALLDQKKLNLGVTVFVSVKTNQHTKEWLSKFARAVRSIPEVVEVYRMAGDVDYLLKVVAPDIEGYDEIYKRLIEAVELTDVSSYFAMEAIKASTCLPLDHCAPE
ncbi:MAG: Lrp/AsnC family transcriptional regulator [Parvularculaceae bacterium]